MLYSISPLTQENAKKVIYWQYDPPYDLYDMEPKHLIGLLNRDYRYHQVLDRSGQLAGYCCFGEDARVPGGDYVDGEAGVLDIGVGLKPDLTGQGLGKEFVRAVLTYAEITIQPEIFRVTVADFNLRSLKTFESLGFKIIGQFTKDLVDMEFTQLERPAKKD